MKAHLGRAVHCTLAAQQLEDRHPSSMIQGDWRGAVRARIAKLLDSRAEPAANVSMERPGFGLGDCGTVRLGQTSRGSAVADSLNRGLHEQRLANRVMEEVDT